MTRPESAIILTKYNTEDHTINHYRLIRTMDLFQNQDVFSVFLTTDHPDGIDEEFIYDISHEENLATCFFNRICSENVTACTLAAVAHDFLAQNE